MSAQICNKRLQAEKRAYCISYPYTLITINFCVSVSFSVKRPCRAPVQPFLHLGVSTVGIQSSTSVNSSNDFLPFFVCLLQFQFPCCKYPVSTSLLWVFFALTVSLFSPRFKKEKKLFIHFFLRLLSRSLARSVFVSLGFKPRRCRVLFSLCCFMICCLHALAQTFSFILLFFPLSLSPLLSLSHCCCLYISAALIFSHLCSFLRLPLLTGLVPSILTFNLSLASFLSSVFSPFCHHIFLDDEALYLLSV